MMKSETGVQKILQAGFQINVTSKIAIHKILHAGSQIVMELEIDFRMVT